MGSDKLVQVPQAAVDDIVVALREHLGRAPTEREIGRGLAEAARDAILGTDETSERAYVAWMARVLGRPCACANCRRVRQLMRTSNRGRKHAEEPTNGE